MSEDDAQAWLLDRHGVPAMAILRQFVALVIAENERQNLIARSSIPLIWNRHVLDSAQLLTHHRPKADASWIDIGSGAGFPGFVIAIVSSCTMTLVEPRRRRADFLRSCAADLGLDNHIDVIHDSIENVEKIADVISARAVSSIRSLFEWSQRCYTSETIWLLPKGRGARDDIHDVQRHWKGTFHVKQSMTSAESEIVIATGVARR